MLLSDLKPLQVAEFCGALEFSLLLLLLVYLPTIVHRTLVHPIIEHLNLLLRLPPPALLTLQHMDAYAGNLGVRGIARVFARVQ